MSFVSSRKCVYIVVSLLLLAGTINYMAFDRIELRDGFDRRVETRATPTVNLMLGGFRGVVADWLWLRAMHLQEQGRFIEIIQLAEWITALQPQFPDIWSLHAWNLAYNITVLLPDGNERWHWIYHAYEILRDQAIPATRYHPRVCAELSWILMHKVGDTSDDFADTFFYQWVQTFSPYLSEDGTISTDTTKQAAFRNKVGLPARKLDAFEGAYGPHDWRHPLTHAAAWAYVGFKQAPDQRETRTAERFFLHTYRQLLVRGNIRTDTDRNQLVLEPDLNRALPATEIFEKAYQRGRQPEIHTAYLSLLERTIQLLAANDQTEEAEHLFSKLAESFPESISAVRGFDALTALPFESEVRIIPIPQETP